MRWEKLIKEYLAVAKEEFMIDFKETLMYKINIVTDILIFTVTYLGIYFFDVSTSFSAFYDINNGTGKILVLIGFLFWQLSCTALGFTSSTIESAASKGYLEMKLQSKFSPIFLFLIELMVYMIFSLVSFIAIILITFIIGNVTIYDLCKLLVSYIYIIPSVLGMFGIGLIIGGITLIQKKVSNIIFIIQSLLLLVSNTLSPERATANAIIPFSLGIDIARKLYLNIGVSLFECLEYIGVNFIWLAIGSVIFNKCLGYAREYLSFDTY